MVDLYADFTTSVNNVLAASDGSIDELHAINQAILTGEGIDQIIESFEEENPTFAKALKDNKDKLKKPDVELEELIGQKLQLDPEVAKKLGLKEDATISEFMQAAFNKILKENKNTNLEKRENTFGLGNLNPETIDLLCLLLCQEGKSQIIDTLKQVLDSKVFERQNLRAQNLAKTNQMIADHVEVQEKLENMKKLSIGAAIAGIVLAVFMATVSIATAGTGTAACIAIALTVVATAAAVASSGCSIASVCTNDQEKQDQLNKAALGLGICSAIIGIIGSGVEIGGTIAAAGISATITAARTAALESAKAAAKEAAESAIKETIETAAKEAAEAAAKAAAKAAVKEATEEGVETATEEGIEAAAKKAAEAAAKDIVKTMAKENSETISEESIETIAEEAAKAATKKAFGKTTEEIMETQSKRNDLISTGVNTISSLTQAGTQIASGVLNLQLANAKKDLANINIEIEKINQAIETLQEIINTLMQDIQKFIDDLLKCEQNVAETLHAKSDVELQLAQKPA